VTLDADAVGTTDLEFDTFIAPAQRTGHEVDFFGFASAATVSITVVQPSVVPGLGPIGGLAVLAAVLIGTLQRLRGGRRTG
jgi:hypothetical protein